MESPFVRKIFDLYDTDKDGYLNESQASSIFAILKIKQVPSKSYTFDQFSASLLTSKVISGTSTVETTLGHIVDTFFHLDYDNDGCISMSDVGSSMAALGHNLPAVDIAFLHRRIDVSGTGCASLEDYVKCVSS